MRGNSSLPLNLFSQQRSGAKEFPVCNTYRSRKVQGCSTRSWSRVEKERLYFNKINRKLTVRNRIISSHQSWIVVKFRWNLNFISMNKNPKQLSQAWGFVCKKSRIGRKHRGSFWRCLPRQKEFSLSRLLAIERKAAFHWLHSS